MAYSDNFPTQRAVFTLDAANAGRLDPRCSFTRASTGSYFGTAKHLSSENLIKHSEGTAVWGGTATVTYNYTNGPDGVTGTALRLESASGTERYRYSTGGQFVSGTAYTVSCWVKSNTGVAQTFRFMCSTTANQSADLTTHATDWTRVTATITPNTTNIFAGFVFLSANTNDISVWGLQVNTGSSALDYQATTTQIHRAYAPTLQTAASGAARFEHSATDGQSMGCLIESQFQQLLPYSEDIADSSWGKSSDGVNPTVTVSSNAAVSPAGDLTADLIVESDDSSNQIHRVQKSGITTASGSVYTLSIFAKASGRNHVHVHYVGGGLNGAAVINLSTGAVDSSTGSLTSITTKDCGNGWWRIVAVTGTTTSTASATVLFSTHDGSSATYTGNGYGSVLLWGANLTQSGHAYSYLKADAAATTKASDSLSADLTEVGYTGGPFTVVSETSDGLGSYPRAFTLTDGSLSNRLTVHRTSGAATTSTDWLFAGIVDGSSNVSETIPSSASAGKLAVSYDTNDVSVCASGGTVATDSSAVFPDGLTTMNIGANYAGGQQLNGHVKRVALYNEALSNTNLQALTS